MRTLGHFIREALISFTVVSVMFLGIILVTDSDRSAHASPVACESIKNADARHFCRATSIPRRSECELIRNHDLRHHCRAVVK